MLTYLTLMHSTPARLIRLFGGLWLVIYGANLAAGYAIALAIVGAAIAVTRHCGHLPDGAGRQRGTLKISWAA